MLTVSVALTGNDRVNLDFGIALAGFLVGIVVGLTGMGGGALMTPILVLGFGIEPLAAVSSDLVAAVAMKPVGGGIHLRRGTVHTGLVKWLALGSVPGALLGSYVISHLSGDVGDVIQTTLGVVLLVAAAAMVVRMYLAGRRGPGVDGDEARRVPVRRAATLAVGLVGGTIVGMTSVGSGSLMIVALMLLYPTLSSRELVGTDLVQAVPLVLAAALGHLVWGQFELTLTTSLLLGSIPGVIIGAQISSRAPDRFIRPVLVLVLALTGLKLLGVSNEVLLVLLVTAIVAGAGAWFVTRRRAHALPAATAASASRG